MVGAAQPAHALEFENVGFAILDHRCPGVAHQLLDRVFLGQAITTEQLQRFTGHLERGLGDIGLAGDRGQQVRAFFAVVVGKHAMGNSA
ncbi:hypothetical protein D3C72_2302000 [compost metagenome]